MELCWASFPLGTPELKALRIPQKGNSILVPVEEEFKIIPLGALERFYFFSETA